MAVLLFSEAFLPGNTLLSGDLSHVFYPGYIYSRECVLQGRLPLWNPYVGCGESFVGDIEHGVFYPPNLVYLLVHTSRAVTILACFHVFLAALGTYVLCRVLKVSRTGSLLAGVLYGFSSYTITKMDFPSLVGSAAWAPSVLAAFFSWLRYRDLRSFLLTAAALCLQLLAGFPEIVAFTVFGLALLALWAGLSDWRARGGWWRFPLPMMVLGAAGFVAILLSLVQFLPTWEALRLSTRSAGVDLHQEFTSVHPMVVFSLLHSSVCGVPGLYWAPSCGYLTGAVYVGVVAIAILAAAAFCWAVRKGLLTEPHEASDSVVRLRTPYLTTMFILFFVVAMGKYTGVFDIICALIPAAKGCSSPAKCLFWVSLSFSCMAGIGLDAVGGGARRAFEQARGGRAFVMHWGAVALFGVLGLFVVACLMSEGWLGKCILTRWFNLGSVPSTRVSHIPWQQVWQDSVKMVVVGLVTALLVRVWATRFRWRQVAAVGIILLAFADLWITNANLLVVGPAAVLDRPSTHQSKLCPRDTLVRFLAFRSDRPVEIRRSRAENLPKPLSVEELEPDALLQTLRGTGFEWARTARAGLATLWPVVDKAFNIAPGGTFPPSNSAAVTDLLICDAVNPDLRYRLLRMLNCDRVLLPPDEPVNDSDPIPARRLLHYGPPMPRAHVVGGVWAFPTRQEVMLALTMAPFDPEHVALVNRQTVGDESLSDLQAGKVKHRIERLKYGPDSLDIEVFSQRAGLLVVSDTYYPGWHAKVNGKPARIYEVNGGFRGVRIPCGQSSVKMAYRPKWLVIGGAVSALTLLSTVALFVWNPRVPFARNRRAVSDQA